MATKAKKIPKSNYARKREFLLRMSRSCGCRVFGFEFPTFKPWKGKKQ